MTTEDIDRLARKRANGRNVKRHLLACALALVAAVAQAGMGTLELPGAAGDGPVTVFYPTAAAERALPMGPYTLHAAPGAPPQRGNGRLVVVSHGSGGGAITYSDLAHRLVDAGFIVVAPEHRGDNWHDMADAGPDSWKRRPGEASRAIDALARDPRFAPLFDAGRVGFYGMSAGGHTALAVAGGRWSPSQLLGHCEAHIHDDFPSCVGLALQLRGDMFDGLKQKLALFVIRRKLGDPQWYSHDDPRFAAVVAEVPFAVDFDMQSLAAPRVPLGLVQARKDKWLAPQYHVGRVIAACKGCEVVADLPGAGHGSLLSPQPVGLPEPAAGLLADPPGFDRAQVPQVHARIAAFFTRHLAP